jgi:hypothetical protein
MTQFYAQIVAHRVAEWAEVVDSPITTVIHVGPYDSEDAADSALDVFLPETYKAISAWWTEVAGPIPGSLVTTSGDIIREDHLPEGEDVLDPSEGSEQLLNVVNTLLREFQQKLSQRILDEILNPPLEVSGE